MNKFSLSNIAFISIIIFFIIMIILPKGQVFSISSEDCEITKSFIMALFGCICGIIIMSIQTLQIFIGIASEYVRYLLAKNESLKHCFSTGCLIASVIIGLLYGFICFSYELYTDTSIISIENGALSIQGNIIVIFMYISCIIFSFISVLSLLNCFWDKNPYRRFLVKNFIKIARMC